MADYQIVLGWLSVIIGLASYVPYFRDIFAGTTKPHPFSWFVWTLITGITFFAQVTAGGGLGAWATGATMVANFAVVLLALRRGERGITKIDWACFVGALAGILVWALTKNPLAAVLIVTVVDALAFAPTVRKAYEKPRSETLSLFVWGVVKYALAIPALAIFNFTTVLFPASVIVLNVLFVGVVLIRRRQVSA
ncbi:MAG: hypothetical protein HYS26_04030 [Candidatus Kaiserbacteria bacterium]|nr:MAG: hypothetical protein HYS26_04030 [Candidatus Kaiserbacteria bacterium]